MYTTTITYGQGIGAEGIGQVSPVANKLLVISIEGGGLMGPAQAIVIPQNLLEIRKVKNPIYSKIEVVFQVGRTMRSRKQWWSKM